MAEVAGSPPQPPPAGRTRSELGARVISAVIMAAAALALAVLGGWPLALLWLLAGLVVSAEWIAMSRAAPRGPLLAILGAGLVLVAALRLFGFGPALVTAAGALAAALGFAIGSTVRDRLWAVGGFVYAVAIVLVPPIVRADPGFGLAGLLWMFAVVWVTDVAAYFTGRALGGPKLWPRVSPKKTWSGFVGGLVAGTAAGLAVIVTAEQAGAVAPVSPFLVVVVSAIASVLGQLGDLAESAVKRHFDVKDSGKLIPGHGGAMDRLDAFWAVCVLVGLLLAAVRWTG